MKYAWLQDGSMVLAKYNPGLVNGVAPIQCDDTVSPDTHYIDNGVILEQPPKPGDGYLFDHAQGAWVSFFAGETLEQAKVVAANLVRRKVTHAREAYITDLPGQDAIYQAKEAEAKAYLAEAAPVLADYPLLDAETGITAANPTELANLWLTMGNQWRSVAALIEAARMTVNGAISGATTAEEIEAALTALDTALAGLPQP